MLCAQLVPPYDSNKEEVAIRAIRLLMLALSVAVGCRNVGRKVGSCAYSALAGLGCIKLPQQALTVETD